MSLSHITAAQACDSHPVRRTSLEKDSGIAILLVDFTLSTSSGSAQARRRVYSKETDKKIRKYSKLKQENIEPSEVSFHATNKKMQPLNITAARACDSRPEGFGNRDSLVTFF